MSAIGALVSAAAPYLLGIGAGAQVLGGVLGAGQAEAAGRAQADAYNQQADAALAQAKNRAAQERDKYNRLAASQRANLGASGADVNVGSPIDVLADTDAEGHVSAMQLLYSGELEAWNARQKAAFAKAEAKNRASSSLWGGILGGLSTGLMGASKLGLLGGGATAASTASKTTEITPYLTQFGRGNNSPVR